MNGHKLTQVLGISFLLLALSFTLAGAGMEHTFGYTINATGSENITTYPDQTFNWTVTTRGTEHWMGPTMLGSQFVGVYGYYVYQVYYLYPPPGTVISSWDYVVAYNWRGGDAGTYLDMANNRLVIQVNSGGYRWCWWYYCSYSDGSYYASYRIYGLGETTTPVSSTQTGTGIINASQGEQWVASFDPAPPPPQHGGTVTLDGWDASSDNPNVTLWTVGTLGINGDLMARTDYTETMTQPWSGSESGSAAISSADGNKFIITSSLAAPNGDTAWTVSDDSERVDTWMEGSALYAWVNNQPPVAEAGGPYSGYEGEPVILDASGSTDEDGQVVQYEWDLEGDGVYELAGAVVAHTWEDDYQGTVFLRVFDDDGDVATDTAEVTVANRAPGVEVGGPASQAVQYSDAIAEVTLTATDRAADQLSAAASWSANGVDFYGGLPEGLSLPDAPECAVDQGLQTCAWGLSGRAGVAAGTYLLRVEILDEDGGVTVTDLTLIVEAEDAMISFAGENPVSVKVAAPSGPSGAFSLAVGVQEKLPDSALYGAEAGDIGRAGVVMTLAPVGPGAAVAGACGPATVSGSGYEATALFTCQFANVPVNTYAVEVSTSGGYYRGAGVDVLVVYDPSLGFTTGGGWFYWPESGEKTTFGYTMKYNRRNTNLQGSLLVIRHMADGSSYRIKSNALDGLALGQGAGLGWATFSGKNTYLQPGMLEPEGGYAFVAYVEDANEPGSGSDRFWVAVYDKSGVVVPGLSLPRAAQDHAVPLGGGNIVVPH